MSGARAAKAGAPKLMTAELIATALRSRPGQPRALMNMAGELLEHRRSARGPPDRREAVPRDLRRPASCRDQGRSRATAMSLLPVEPAWRLAERAEEQRWLVTGLWSEQAVGIVGGEPKCCKIASSPSTSPSRSPPASRACAASPCRAPGRVLLYAAEDALHIVRRRLEGICAAAGVALADLDIQVITAPTLRLDLDADRRSLAETVARLQPRLLILDPFVRLHRIDENASGEVAPLLAYLRELQRRHARRRARRPPRQEGRRPRLAPARRCAAPPSSTPGATPISICAATGDDSHPDRRASRRAIAKPMTLELVNAADALALEVAERRTPQRRRPSSARRAHRRRSRRCRPPATVRRAARANAASAPPPSMSGSPR